MLSGLSIELGRAARVSATAARQRLRVGYFEIVIDLPLGKCECRRMHEMLLENNASIALQENTLFQH